MKKIYLFFRTIPGRLKDEKGLGLVESMVAIGLLGAGVIAFASALAAGSLTVNEHSQETTAQRLAQAQLESIKSAMYDASGTSYTTVSAPSGYSVSFSVNSAIYATDDIQKITVTVSRDSVPVLSVEDYKVNR